MNELEIDMYLDDSFPATNQAPSMKEVITSQLKEQIGNNQKGKKHVEFLEKNWHPLLNLVVSTPRLFATWKSFPDVEIFGNVLECC